MNSGKQTLSLNGLDRTGPDVLATSQSLHFVVCTQCMLGLLFSNEANQSKDVILAGYHNYIQKCSITADLFFFFLQK